MLPVEQQQSWRQKTKHGDKSRLRVISGILCALCLSLLVPQFSWAHSHFEDAPLLVDSEWLSQKLSTQKTSDPHPAIPVDLRSKAEFLKGHIPNAINIPIEQFHRDVNNIKGFALSPLNFKKLVEQKGIKNAQHLVFYHNERIIKATRAFWIFDFYGHESMSVLNTGFDGWKKRNNPVSIETPSPQYSNYVLSIKPEKLTSKFNVQIASKLQSSEIIDARPTPEFIGQKTKGARAGHIPNAESLPWTELVDGNKEIINIQNISKILKSNIRTDKPIILYCNGGAESSLLYFGLKTMGIKSSIYDGSWNEWSADYALPIETIE